MIRYRFAVAMLGVLGALSGCVVGPEYRPPTPVVGAQAPLVSANPAAETTAEPPDKWWQLYHNAMLDRLIAETLTTNTDLRIATANLSAARSVLEAARASLYPQTAIDAAGTYGRDPSTEEILELGGHAPANTWIFDALLGISYEVDLFGRVRRSVEEARAHAGAVTAARDRIKVTIVAETTRAFAQVCTLGEEIAVANHSLEVVRREADITAKRHEAGGNSQFDVVRALGLVAEVRASIPPLGGQRRAALFELTALLGRAPSEAPLEVEACVTPPRLTELIPVGDGATLLKRRPDVREADRHLAAATARIGIATADLYPKIVLEGFYGGASPQLDQLTTNKGLIWGLGPSVSWTFPNQAGPRARVREAKANATARLAGFDAVVLRALKEVEQALASYGAEIDHRQALTERQHRAQEAFDIAHDQYLAGSITNLDLLTSEQSLVAADAAVAGSDSALVQDQIAVFKALGGGWHGEAAGANEKPVR